MSTNNDDSGTNLDEARRAEEESFLEEAWPDKAGKRKIAPARPGGAAFSDRETSKIIGRSLSRKLSNYYGRGITSDKDETYIHDYAEKFVGCLDIDSSVVPACVQRVEASALKIRKSTKMRIRDAVAVSLCVDAQGYGLIKLTRLIAKVAPDLAELHALSVRCDSGGEEISVYVNGAKRNVHVEQEEDDSLSTVTVPLYAFDGGALIRFEGIRCFVRGVYEEDDSWKNIAQVVDKTTLRLKEPLNASKCFKLYKLMKKAAVDLGIFDGEGGKRSLPTMNANIDDEEARKVLRRRFPISKLPSTEFILRQAGCLSQVQKRFLQLFSERFGAGNGVSDATIAESSLIQAGEEAYNMLPMDRRIRVNSLTRRMGVREGGLILQSEIKRSW